jgi:hypothetical protein
MSTTRSLTLAAQGVKPPRLFPFCLVWTPIPLITWIMPFIGHMGTLLTK